jgi:hypothetical protein
MGRFYRKIQMKKLYKIILIVVTTLVVIFGAISLLTISAVKDLDMKSFINEQIIDFKELDSKVYLRGRVWGLAGNHEEIIISTSPIDKSRKPIIGKDYIFYYSEIYFKRQGLDTLVVYAESSSIAKIPENLSSPIKVIISELKTYDKVKDFQINYRNYGLTKFNICNKQPSTGANVGEKDGKIIMAITLEGKNIRGFKRLKNDE